MRSDEVATLASHHSSKKVREVRLGPSGRRAIEAAAEAILGPGPGPGRVRFLKSAPRARFGQGHGEVQVQVRVLHVI